MRSAWRRSRSARAEFDQLGGAGQAAQVGEGHDAGQSALQLADVRLHAAGDGLHDIVGEVGAGALGFGVQDREAGFDIGRLDVGGEPQLEARAQALFQGEHRFGRPVRGDDDLFILSVEGIEGVEELFLGGFFAGDKLDVINQQDVDPAVFVAESLRGVSCGWR